MSWSSAWNSVSDIPSLSLGLYRASNFKLDSFSFLSSENVLDRIVRSVFDGAVSGVAFF